MKIVKSVSNIDCDLNPEFSEGSHWHVFEDEKPYSFVRLMWLILLSMLTCLDTLILVFLTAAIWFPNTPRYTEPFMLCLGEKLFVAFCSSWKLKALMIRSKLAISTRRSFGVISSLSCIFAFLFNTNTVTRTTVIKRRKEHTAAIPAFNGFSAFVLFAADTVVVSRVSEIEGSAAKGIKIVVKGNRVGASTMKRDFELKSVFQIEFPVTIRTL
ncbi:hypothetical protein LXL04_031614 [Taraxacum kok-saghyz]